MLMLSEWRRLALGSAPVLVGRPAGTRLAPRGRPGRRLAKLVGWTLMIRPRRLSIVDEAFSRSKSA